MCGERIIPSLNRVGNTPRGCVAYRSKANVNVTKNPDRTEVRQWGGAWEWKWLVDNELLDIAPQ